MWAAAVLLQTIRLIIVVGPMAQGWFLHSGSRIATWTERKCAMANNIRNTDTDDLDVARDGATPRGGGGGTGLDMGGFFRCSGEQPNTISFWPLKAAQANTVFPMFDVSALGRKSIPTAHMAQRNPTCPQRHPEYILEASSVFVGLP